MDVTPLIPSDAQVIQAYQPGRFRISNVVHEGPVLVRRTATIAWTPPPALPPDEADLQRLLQSAQDPAEVVLLGTGASMLFIPPSLLRRIGAGRGLEVMDTGAACRTYNVLLAEGRAVLAALIPL